MGAEDEAETVGSQRWAAFLAYAHADNRTRYIDHFYQVFVETLASHGITKKVFLDNSEKVKYGDIKKYFRERASMADFLVIFVGNQYPHRQFCLFEWDVFRSQFRDKEQARERLCIIEIDSNSITKLLGEANKNDKHEMERAEELKSIFHENRLIKGDKKVYSKNADAELNQEFEDVVKQIAIGFAERYRDLQSKAPPRRVEPRPARELSETPVGPQQQTTIDVVIAAVTPDLEAAATALKEGLEGRHLQTRRIDAPDLLNLDDDELRDKLQSAKWLVQPFSWHRVTNANTRGGHLVRQVSLFDRPEGALFWCPEGALSQDKPPKEWAEKIENRPEHVETLSDLHSKRSLTPRRYPIIFGKATDVISRIVPPPEPGPTNRPPARIMWENDEKIADRLTLAAQFTEQRCAFLSADFRVRNIIFELKDLFEEPAEWPRDAHGLILTDYAKKPKELLRYINPGFPGCRLPKATLLRCSTPGKAERAGTWVGASREVAQTQLFGAAPRIWRVVSSFRVDLGRTSPAGLSSFIAPDPHAGSGGGLGRRSWIRRRMSANRARGTATSASWKTT